MMVVGGGDDEDVDAGVCGHHDHDERPEDDDSLKKMAICFVSYLDVSLLDETERV